MSYPPWHQTLSQVGGVWERLRGQRSRAYSLCAERESLGTRLPFSFPHAHAVMRVRACACTEGSGYYKPAGYIEGVK